MAVDAFLEFDPSSNIKSESLDSQHGQGKGDCMQIEGYGFEVKVPASAIHGQGLGSGKLEFGEFSFKSKIAKHSFAVFKHITLGTHIPKAKLYLRKAGGGSDTGQKDFVIYTFEQLMITKYAVDGSSEDPQEEMAFAYTKLHIEYRMQKADGSVARAGSWGYDLKENKGKE